MTEVLDRINQATEPDAESAFRDCCGSHRWASSMAFSRPFVSESEVLEKAGTIWNGLEPEDWIEAFAAHPKIGESEPAPGQRARSAGWSTGEQAGMGSADGRLRNELSEANEAYYEKFGFIFIVCATGKSAEEMLELCLARLVNGRETEIAIAAAEQQKITEIRLRKLLSQ